MPVAAVLFGLIQGSGRGGAGANEAGRLLAEIETVATNRDLGPRELGDTDSTIENR